MTLKPSFRLATLTLACLLAAPGITAADDDRDFGQFVEQQLQAKSEKLFGVERPLAASAPATRGAYRTPSQPAYDQVLVADGLKVRYLTLTGCLQHRGAAATFGFQGSGGTSAPAVIAGYNSPILDDNSAAQSMTFQPPP